MNSTEQGGGRAENQSIEQLTPERKTLTSRAANGDSLDCLGGVLNDLPADSMGGVYFTMGGLYYANPKGVVTRYGENLTTNGIVLSDDEKAPLCHERTRARGIRCPDAR